MPTTPRLEDQHEKWQRELDSAIRKEVSQLQLKWKQMLSQSGEDGPAQFARMKETGEQSQREFARQLLSRCPQWLVAQELWPEKNVSPWVETDLNAALNLLPPLPLSMPQVVLEMPLRSWMLSAGVGAFLGMLAGAPLSWLMLGQREVGLAVGGILGSLGVVGAIGRLSQMPAVRSHLTKILAAGSAGSVLVGLWNFYRTGTTGLFRMAVGLGVSSLLLFFTRPIPRPVVDEAQQAALLELHYRLLADLILGWCWAHPDRTPAVQPDVRIASRLPSSITDTLAELYTDTTAGRSAEDIRDMVEVLFEKFAQAGYVWTTIPSGTLFQDSFLDHYEILGRPGSMDRVRTRRAALLVDGKIERRGELRRIE